ncbi:MAG: hypothetical protein WAT12_06210 [Candidatus Nitrotoga sp.]
MTPSILLFDQYAQHVNGFAKVDRLAAQIDLLDMTTRMHQIAPCVAARSKTANHSGEGNTDMSRRNPEGSASAQ